MLLPWCTGVFLLTEYLRFAIIYGILHLLLRQLNINKHNVDLLLKMFLSPAYVVGRDMKNKSRS